MALLALKTACSELMVPDTLSKVPGVGKVKIPKYATVQMSDVR